MSRNGTDRDVAKMLLDALNAIKTAVANINAHLFSAYIITQPEDGEGGLNDPVTFSVVAANVTAYQWEVQSAGSPWHNSSLATATTSSITVTFTTAETLYDREFRCKLTGTDGGIVYTNVAHFTAIGG